MVVKDLLLRFVEGSGTCVTREADEPLSLLDIGCTALVDLELELELEVEVEVEVEVELRSGAAAAVEEEEEEEVVSYIFIKTSPHKIGVLMSLFLEVAKKIRRTI